MAFSNICGLIACLNVTPLSVFQKALSFLLQRYIGKSSLKYLKYSAYELHHTFRLHVGVCVFLLNSVSFTRLYALETQNKDILWLQLSSKIFKKYVLLVSLFPRKSHLGSHKISKPKQAPKVARRSFCYKP